MASVAAEAATTTADAASTAAAAAATHNDDPRPPSTLSTAATALLARGRPPRTQRELMLFNYRLGFFNLAANWANLHRTRYLEGAVAHGRAQLDELTAQVTAQHAHLDTLAQSCEDAHNAVRDQQHAIGTTLEKFGAEVARQNAVLANQQAAMQALVASKFQRDAAVDTSIAAISGFFATTPFVRVPVYLTTMWLPGRLRWLASTLLRLAAFLQVAMSLRNLAVEKGVHNAVGTPAAYVTMAINFLRVKTKEIMARNRKARNGERAEAAAKVVAASKDVEKQEPVL